MKLDTAKRLAFMSMVGVVLVTLSQVVLLLFQGYLPPNALEFKSLQQPIAWFGIPLALLFFVIGTRYKGTEIAASTARMSFFLIGICLFVTFLSSISWLEEFPALKVVLVASNLFVAILSVRSFLRCRSHVLSGSARSVR